MSVTNLVSATITPEDQKALLDAIAVLRTKLPFLIGLSKEDRRTLPKLGERSQPFVGRAVQIATANPTVLPPSFDLVEFQHDWALWQSMRPFMTQFTQISELINDTDLALGSDLYSEGLAVYAYLKAAGKGAGLEELKSTLSQRFKRSTPVPTDGQPVAPAA